ncbi:MAG: Zn-binding domain-containing protein, partial [Actinomycetota bacterium]|nr:Zn-binding domain-containing protein [Actinomycetota bacterium]
PGGVGRLDHTYLELRLRDDDHRPHRCDACGALTWRTVAGICPAWRCDGRVEPDRDDDALEQNHYVRLYRDLLPMGMAVEEHTAQWTATEASRIQEDFIRGRVNVLSCSTTFELGVDVGDVSAVLLRNVPPLAANYIQRAGRAGRRTGAAALVVTYAQRRSHDRAHYEDPTTMVAGTIDPPIVALDNVPIARRHLHSVAFAAHQRHLVGAGGEAHRRVEDFFTPVAGHEHTGDAAFVSWLRSRPESLREALERILPTPIAEAVDVAGWGWVDALATETADEPSCGWLRRAGDEVRDDLGRLDTMIDEAFDERDGRRGDRLSATRRTLAQRQLLGFLASRNVLPKYGFPVDVVPLDVASGSDGDGTAAKLELDRDLSLAIADYAPGAEVVAAKTRWRSAGLRKLPDRELPVYHWRLCADCGGFASALEELTDTCECGGTTTRDRGTFIRPEFGFVGRRAGDAGESRPRRRALVRTWFGAYRHEPPAFEWVAGLDGPIKVRSRTSRQGRINVVNSGPDGRRFRICDRCGHGEPTPAAAPRTASGSRRVAAGPDPHDDLRRPGRACAGTMRSHALGHEYLTDVTELRLERPLTEPVARSVLYALLEGVPALGVARADVDGTLHRSATDGARSLVLFDAVPGGAGYAQLLAEQLPRLFQAALRRVTSCECGPETACYSCLWNYRNQPFHEELARGDAAIVLSDILGDGVTRT